MPSVFVFLVTLALTFAMPMTSISADPMTSNQLIPTEDVTITDPFVDTTLEPQLPHQEEITEMLDEGRQSWRQELIEAAESQLGVRYQSVHYGPKGDPFGNGEGFGCAMFVAYAYNTVFFDGHRGDDNSHQTEDNQWFCGYTAAFWAAVTGEPNNDTNWGLVEVPAEEAQPGDVICFLHGDNHYSSRLNCGHVSMYYGDGQQIDGGGGSIHDVDMSDPNLHFLTFAESDVVHEYEARHDASLFG